MMAKLFLPLFLIVAVVASGASAQVRNPNLDPSIEPRALEIKFFGGITGFDETAYKMLRSTIGQLFSEGTLSKVVTTEWGKDWGRTFCVELEHNPNVKIETVVNHLKVLKPSDVTIYSYQAINKCEEQQ